MDEALDEWLEGVRQNLAGVPREDERWAESEQRLREFMGQQKPEEEENLPAIFDVAQLPASALLVEMQEGQWICEICNIAVSSARYRCTSCGRVNFSAFQALNREQADFAIALGGQILQRSSPQVAALQPQAPNPSLHPAHLHPPASQPPRSRPASLPVPDPANKPSNPPKQPSPPGTVQLIEPKKASIPAVNKQMPVEVPNEVIISPVKRQREAEEPLPENKSQIIEVRMDSEESSASRRSSSSKKGGISTKACCSLS